MYGIRPARPDLPPHPLQQWRLRQRVTNPADGTVHVMTQQEAAREAGVPLSTWVNWERWPEQGGRIPRGVGMAAVARVTRGEIAPGHFFRQDAAA